MDSTHSQRLLRLTVDGGPCNSAAQLIVASSVDLLRSWVIVAVTRVPAAFQRSSRSCLSLFPAPMPPSLTFPPTIHRCCLLLLSPKRLHDRDTTRSSKAQTARNESGRPARSPRVFSQTPLQKSPHRGNVVVHIGWKTQTALLDRYRQGWRFHLPAARYGRQRL